MESDDDDLPAFEGGNHHGFDLEFDEEEELEKHERTVFEGDSLLQLDYWSSETKAAEKTSPNVATLPISFLKATQSQAPEKNSAVQSNQTFRSSAEIINVPSKSANGLTILVPMSPKPLRKENSFTTSYKYSSNTVNTPSSKHRQSHRLGLGGSLYKGEATQQSTIEEEQQALMELYAAVGEEHREKLVLKRNEGGFITHLEIYEVQIHGNQATYKALNK